MKNIFLADDDADDRDFFADALKEVKMETELITANDGMELMSSLDEKVTVPPPPHVIFLDLNMPRKNGYECLKEIRETDKLKNIPVVVFSTSENKHAIDTAYDLGANCYIRKPKSHELLIQSIETVMGLDLWRHNRQLPKKEFVIALS
ncbi:MAG TPA: response regulator [Cyclobacteriaceae bacterium]|nr:response regulator [Cyclobacteriaceae bacterium]